MVGAFCVYPDEYRPRQPKSTPLFRLLDTHYGEFRNVYIEYRFRLSDDKTEEFRVELDPESLNLMAEIPEIPPVWTELDFHQCPNCPLDKDSHRYCPLALSIVEIVDHFDHVLSYDRIHLEVLTEDRHISQQISAQMGLLIATSGCPYTNYFKPMGCFHLPLASREETIYRAVSTYLLAQYFIHREGREADSPVNAIVILDIYAKAIPFVIEDSLEYIKYLFTPFINK